MWKKSDLAEESNSQLSSAPQPPPTPAPAPRSPALAQPSRAVIGPTITIKGDLIGEEDLLIEGRVEGKVEFRNHSVTVGKNGRIKADINGKTIAVEGNVEGNLFGEEQLIVRQSGTVRGNIVAPRVALEDGSNFKGSIDMSPKDKPTAIPAPDKPSAIIRTA
jgi:cytoskeletal protein CcmA (bactofilin family)